jgi:hypothetical protein
LHFLRAVDNNQGPFHDFKTLECCDAPLFDLLLRKCLKCFTATVEEQSRAATGESRKFLCGVSSKDSNRKGAHVGDNGVLKEVQRHMPGLGNCELLGRH